MKLAHTMVAGLSLVALAIAPGVAAAKDQKPTTDDTTSPSANPRTSNDMHHHTDRHHREDPHHKDMDSKKAELDRADQAAADHGKHGRDNAHEKHSR